MELKKYEHYSTDDLVADDAFIKWVINPDQENNDFWQNFIQQYPHKKSQVIQASKIIQSFRVMEPSVTDEQINRIYRNIGTAQNKTRQLFSLIGKAAAVIIVLVVAGGIIYYEFFNITHFPEMIVNAEQVESGKMIMPDGSINEFEAEKTEIKQTDTGALTINNDTIAIEASSKSNKDALAQLIIPYGKRSEITLSDGSRIWLNSGSQLSYPLSFTGNSRDVYLTGEAFFDVTPDQNKPFNVYTNDLVIKVKGTKFNIISYAGDLTSQAVLISGQIDAARNKRFTRSMKLQPGERATYNRKEDNIEIDHVDVELYSSWIDGYLVFENEPVTHIFTKLERYYNQHINILTQNEEPTFTGKLDLADDLESVLKNIGLSANFTIELKNDDFIVKQL